MTSRYTFATLGDRLMLIGSAYGIVAYTCLYFFDRWMPRHHDIFILTGAIQMLRTATGLYIETWFMGAPRIMVTIPMWLAFPALVLQVTVIYAISFWLALGPRNTQKGQA